MEARQGARSGRRHCRTPGGGPANPLTIKAVELLEDGEWREQETLLAAIGKLVPPGRAVRRAEGLRHQGPALAERARAAPVERLIRIGQRNLARESLSSAPGSFEFRSDEAGVRWVRLVRIPARVARDRARQAEKSNDHVELAPSSCLLAVTRFLEPVREVVPGAAVWMMLAMIWPGLAYSTILGRRHHRERMAVIDERFRRLTDRDLSWPI